MFTFLLIVSLLPTNGSEKGFSSFKEGYVYHVTLTSDADLRLIYSIWSGYAFKVKGAASEPKLLTTWTHEPMHEMTFEFRARQASAAFSFAWDLSRSIPSVELQVTEAGWWTRDEKMKAMLISAGVVVVVSLGVLLLWGGSGYTHQETPPRENPVREDLEVNRRAAYAEILHRAQPFIREALPLENFHKDGFPAAWARTNRDQILSHPDEYLDHYKRLREDREVWDYFQTADPHIIRIFEGRVKAYHLAEELKAGRTIGTSTPDEHRERVLNRTDIKHQDQIAAEKAAFSQRIEKLAELHQHAEALTQKYPHLKKEIEIQLAAYYTEESEDEAPSDHPIY